MQNYKPNEDDGVPWMYGGNFGGSGTKIHCH